ncbi:hypothetical protein [Ureibacillus chungkukjangi]|uniref:Uncharacterized protein n=1 Tax=Ureibacillus chungkukjangi TaxID=1202712 RepID=A0A318TNJ2_9BACL|nr:hypothetical protein [Ureibacillus chungkukjangi]MCM3388157.1 hypothetical protein [Ureibacillus chungkukjangi]MDI7743728.1 hypothetical protein [Lysinibacillus fusiformis]PYF06184.1 hypothetical protein BJ095_11113 [Ureibacillus chungkukjangi]
MKKNGNRYRYLTPFQAGNLSEIPYSQSKILNLVKEGLIEINDQGLININSLNKFIEKEKLLNEKYIFIRDFVGEIGMSRDASIKPFREGIIKLSKEGIVKTENWREKLYVERKFLNIINGKYKKRIEALKDLNLSLFHYSKFKEYFNLEDDIYLTDIQIYMPINSYDIIEKFLREHISIKKIKEIKGIPNRVIFAIAKRENVKAVNIGRSSLTYFPTDWVANLISKKSLLANGDYITLGKAESLDFHNKNQNVIRAWALKGNIEYINGTDGYMYISLKSFREYFTYITKLFEVNMPFHDAAEKIIGYRPGNISKFRSKIYEYNTLFRVVNLNKPVHGYTDLINKSDVYRFLEDHVSLNDLTETHNLSYSIVVRLAKEYGIENITFSQSRNHQFYRKRKIENIIKKYLNIDNYYSKQQVIKLLNLTVSTYYKLLDEENLKPVITNKMVAYFDKDKIHDLKVRQLEYREKYYSNREIRKMFGTFYYKHQMREFILKGNTLIRTAFDDALSVENFYLKEPVNQIYKEYILRKQISQIDYSDPVEAFKRYQVILEINFSENILYTKQQWYNFCVDKLQLTTGSIKTTTRMVSEFVKCTSHLVSITQEKELYELTANSINLKLFNINKVTVSQQRYLHTFLKEYYAVLKMNNKPVFRFDWITNPYNYSSEQIEKGIYDFAEYQELFNYVNNVELHKMKAISDVSNVNDREYSNYSSSWLYVLVHMNNAWRHSDVIHNIPRINLEELHDLNFDEKWFIDNNLSDSQANLVVNQIIRKDIKVSKTQATSHFFCSDDLRVSFATAAILCEIRTRKIEMGLLSNSKEKKINHIINFSNKNQVFNEIKHREFFAEFYDTEFVFRSRKMNRSLLSYLYVLLVKKGKSSAALEIAQRLRSHEDFETTNIYIDIPQVEIDHLSRQLFQRKEFGFIPNLIAEVIFGELTNREQRTSEIEVLSNKLGDVLKIEATSGYVNSITADKKLVANRILSMGFEEATNFLFSIQNNLLPSKEEHYQCLYSEDGCKKRGLSCKNCPFSIPNFYALSSLTSSIEELIINFKEDFENSALSAEKKRISNILSFQLDLLDEAIDKFGKIEVFKFFDGEMKGFFDLLLQLDEIPGIEGYL